MHTEIFKMQNHDPEVLTVEDGTSDSDVDQDNWDSELIKAVHLKVGKSEEDPEKARLDRIQLCLDEGANINAKDRNGNTILHVAVRKGFQRIAAFLRLNGADIDIPNIKGDTAISLAKTLQKRYISSILDQPVRQPSEPETGDFIPVADDWKASTSCGSNIVLTQQKLTTVQDDSKMIIPRAKPHSSEHKENTYSASSTLTTSWPGIMYQFKHLAFTLHCALEQRDPNLLLATKMIAAEKLDDVVLLYENENGKQVGRFVQIKHEAGKISAHQLLEEKGQFSMLKYFISWRKIRENELFANIKVRNTILCTTKGLDLNDLQKNEIHCEAAVEPDKCFELRGNKTAWYKFSVGKENNEKLYNKLKATSDGDMLSQLLATCIYEGKNSIRLDIDSFQYYHVALVKNVFDHKTKEFHQRFIDNEDLPPKVATFRRMFVSDFRRIARLGDEEHSAEYVWGKMKKLFQKQTFPKKFGKAPKIASNPQLANLDDFSRYFVKLMNNAKNDTVVKIVLKKSRNEVEEYPVDILKENIENLAGHVLVKVENKIKFSSQFLKDGTRLSGNIGIFKKALIDNVGNENELERFEFVIKNYDPPTERDLLTKDELPDDCVHDTDITEFLKEYTMAVDQPNEDELDDIIGRKIGKNSKFNLMNTGILNDACQSKIMNWFVKKNKPGKKKEYFSYKVGEKFLKDMNAAVRRFISIEVNALYCELLEKYDVSFKSEMQRVKVFLTGNRFHFTSGRILELQAPGETLLTALRIYDTLQKTQEYEKMDTLVKILIETYRD